ncbi:MAG: hypothetical protein ABW068_16965 [Candidatus Thiodiazotropha sp.]
MEYSEELYTAAAMYIHGLRNGTTRYPIYLTSVRLGGLNVSYGLYTVNLLNLKKRVEDRLNGFPLQKY